MRMVRGGEDTFLELKVKLSNAEKITQEIVALANTSGGVIVFGVNDQMRVEGLEDTEEVREELVRICRENIVPALVPYIDCLAFDNGRRIIALDIDGKRRPYRTRDGRYYIRIGAEKREASREELSALMDEARPLSYENVPTIGGRLTDIDEAHLWSFMREFEGTAFSAAHAAGYPTGEVLERELLLATSSISSDGEPVPTVAGLLLFGGGERVAELLPRASITAMRYAGNSLQDPLIERVQLTGNLHTLYELALRFVARYCALWDTRPPKFPGSDLLESPVAARANYHRNAVTEAIANMLAHRDLSLRDQSTRIIIFDRSIEFLNPRRTAGFTAAAQKSIRYGVPHRINPQLAALFSNPAYGLKLASGGLPMLMRQSQSFSGRRAEIHAFNDEFRLRLYGA